METIADIVSPPLLAACAALALGIGAALFFIYRRGTQGALVLRAPLSWTEPIEIRLVLYMLFASACATVALMFRFLFMLPGEGSAISGLFSPSTMRASTSRSLTVKSWPGAGPWLAERVAWISA